MSDKILYENYVKETGLILTLEEWLLIERSGPRLKKMESYFDALKRFGIVGLASYISGDKTIKDSAEGGILSIPLGLILYAGFNKMTNECKDNCDTIICIANCNITSCGHIIKQIVAAINSVKAKPGYNLKSIKKLNKQLENWVKKYNKYNKRIINLKKTKKDKIRKLKIRAKRAKDRFYAGR